MPGLDDGPDSPPNGLGAAAILAAGIGWFTFGLLDLAGQRWPAAGAAFNIWKPSGPLSGVSTAAIGVWVLAWMLLAVRWRARDLRLGRVNAAAFAMLAAGLLLTFPPFTELLAGQ
jgi:hypothetical protein